MSHDRPTDRCPTCGHPSGSTSRFFEGDSFVACTNLDHHSDVLSHDAEVEADPLDRPTGADPACTGASGCRVAVHFHGCYADRGSCDEPEAHHPIGYGGRAPALDRPTGADPEPVGNPGWVIEGPFTFRGNTIIGDGRTTVLRQVDVTADDAGADDPTVVEEVRELVRDVRMGCALTADNEWRMAELLAAGYGLDAMTVDEANQMRRDYEAAVARGEEPE